MRRVSKTLVAALAVFLLAVGVAACGGGDNSDSTSAAAGGQGQSESKSSGTSANGSAKSGDQGESGTGNGGGKSGGEGQAGNSPDASDFVPKHHQDSGGGSQRLRVKGGDNSVQEFGEEADTSELDAAAVALHNFLDARAEGNWAAACKYMSKGAIESFEQLAAQAKQNEGTSCGEILERLTNPAAKAALEVEAEKADVGSLRIEDEHAFVIYTGIGGTILAIPMENEGGAWKVASLAGTPLN